MNPEEVMDACSQLEQLTATLGSDAELPVIIEALDKLPGLFPVFNESFSQPRGNAADLPAVRASLQSLQQALVHVEKRLQREHQSILLQLHELSAQQEWAQLSRQSG